jgi:hypothetical protein
VEHPAFAFLMKDLPDQPPSPWTLTESPGDSLLLLTRQYNDETIEVRVVADEVRFYGKLQQEAQQRLAVCMSKCQLTVCLCVRLNAPVTTVRIPLIV